MSYARTLEEALFEEVKTLSKLKAEGKIDNKALFAKDLELLKLEEDLECAYAIEEQG